MCDCLNLPVPTMINSCSKHPGAHFRNGFCSNNRKVVTGSRDCISGRQSGAVGRQIKYWILGTVKRLPYSKKNDSNGCLVVMGHKTTGVQIQIQGYRASMKPWRNTAAPTEAPAICHVIGYVWVACLASRPTSWACCAVSVPISLISVIGAVNWVGLFKKCTRSK